jgi:hypothetical protein
MHPVAFAASVAAGAAIVAAPAPANEPTNLTPVITHAPAGERSLLIGVGDSYPMGLPLQTMPREGARYTASLDEGRIELYLDFDEEDMHITAEPNHSAKVMESLLVALEGRGIEVLPMWEHPVELLDDGRTRRYLAHIYEEAA